MSEERADDLRPEYDFSQAARGRHARLAISPGEEPPSWYLTAAQFDRQAWLGEALRLAQELESLLFAYLVLVFERDPGIAARRLPSMLEHPDDPGAQELLHALVQGSSTSIAELRQRLLEVFRERNWLVHRSLQAAEPGDTLDALRAFTSRLQEMSSHLSSLRDEILRSMEARLVGDVMSPAEFQERKSAAIRAWLAA